MDWATESDTGTGAEMLAASGRTAGRGRFLGRVFLSAGTAITVGSSAEVGCSAGVAALSLGGTEAVFRLGSIFFSFAGASCVGNPSAGAAGWSGTAAASCLVAIATV